MPKVFNTRKQKARRLLNLCLEGPSLSMGRPDRKECEREVKLWLESWVTPLVKELVPELKEKR